ncbi:MAG: zinc metalloprotease [Dermatophilaceae bacterium]|nr:zinc metalloprotease [Dermatophilaceae bacterium]MBP9918400.1 zinc metalloprotease [Dermatophilaceae bacterium]
MIRRTRARVLGAALAAGLAALSVSSATAVTTASAAPTTRISPAAAECVDDSSAASGARVRDGSTAKEPKLYPDNQANAYGALKDSPRMPNGSVTIPTVFHVISDHALTVAETGRWTRMINDQMTVLNDSFSGKTAGVAADSPFRFDLTKITWTVNSAWYAVTPGKVERDMKTALYEGDSRMLNVYSANIGAGLLGWAYFPKGYNNGRDYIDGVVMLDESMPGGTAGRYALGDTLTHEVGHWMMLEHTFAHGCAASGDWVEDTPKEAQPQFGCPEGADSCLAPGLDPIHNFMDYSQDSCMNHFTPGQVERMNDAWIAFRDPTKK